MITMIAAYDNNRCLGVGNSIPWRQKADMLHFKENTMGHIIVMGRKTLEAMGGPLRGRTNIVVSRSLLTQRGCIQCSSIDQVLAFTAGYDLWIIGGGSIYEQFMPIADRLLVTEIDTEVAGNCDTKFPVIDNTQFKRIKCGTFDADDENEFCYTFVEYFKRH